MAIVPSQFYPIETTQGRIAVWDSQGDGKVVFFIHGNSARYQVWEHQFSSELAKKYRFIAIDLPGHGNSDKPLDPVNTYTYMGYAQVVHEVMIKLNLSNPIVVAWSLGANVAFALTTIRSLAGLLITGASPIPMNEGKMDMAQAFNLNSKMAALISLEQFDPQQAIDFLSCGGFDAVKVPFMLESVKKTDEKARSMIVASRNEGRGCCDCKKIAETNDTSLAIVLGNLDGGPKLSYLHSIRYKNLYKEIYVVEQAGHAVFWDQPQRFNDILNQFIAHNSKK